MNQTSQKRWLIDAALFTGFLTCFFLDLTGVPLHQWLGIAAGALAAYHLVAHRNWVQAVADRFFGKTSNQARLYYLLDVLILTGFLAMLGSGLVISTWLSLALADYVTWHTAHVAASLGTLAAVTLKIGLHGKWVISMARKMFGAAPSPSGARTPAAVPVTSDVDRRAFIKLIGVIGAASMVAFGTSIKSLSASSGAGENNASTSSTSTSSSTGTRNSSSSVSGSNACAVLCGRRCSYPGHCRRYTDSNGNGRCDLGECAS